MATVTDAIRLTATLRVENGNFKLERDPGAIDIDQNNQGADYHIQNIGFAAHEAITVSADVTTLGVSYLRNLDSTNYVEIGVDVAASFYPLLRLNAGEGYPLRFAQGITMYAQANTAAVDLEIWINED